MNYGNAAGFIAYHTARGRAAQIASYDEDDIDPALVVASEWLDARYRSSFPGTKVGMRQQEREWPRVSGVDIYGYSIPWEVVPVEVENATYEAALRAMVKPGSLTVDYTPNKYKAVSIDGALSVQFASFGGAMDVQLDIAIVAQILAPLLTGSGSVSSLSGGLSRV